MIKVTNLNKYFFKGKSNQIHVINDTTLELPDNGLITFLGHSGSGKTTLLNVIGGLDKASGTIEYDSMKFSHYNMTKIDDYRSKNIGYVFQNYDLLKDETVYDNLKIALELIGVTDEEEIAKRIEYSLKAVGMYKYRKKLAYALSGGQQQRVSIARALLKNSKIIIADEPTGNLDSTNTIEVMNILKKISEKSLVLLVTHETHIAEFYSDYVFELSDGKVVKEYENSGEKSLKRDGENTLYLKDMEYLENNSDICDLSLYATGDKAKLKLELYYKNGTYYLKAPENLKLLNDTNIKVVDDHYHDQKVEDLKEFNYDSSWYSDKKGKKNIFKNIIESFRKSRASFKGMKKKGKLIKVSLFFIGIFFAIAMASCVNSFTFDMTSYEYAPGYYTNKCEDYDYASNQTAFYREAYQAGEIDNVTLAVYVGVSYSCNTNYTKNVYYYENLLAIPYSTNPIPIKYGKAPSKDNEMAIGELTAKSIIKKMGNNYQVSDLVGVSLKIDDTEYIVTGITKNDNGYVYLPLSVYTNILFGSDYFRYYDYSFDRKGKENRYYEYEEGLYEISSGNPIDKNSDELQALVSSRDTAKIGDSIFIDGVSYKVVGKYLHTFNVENAYITNKKQDQTLKNTMFSLVDYESHIKFISGKAPEKRNEVALPVNSGYAIGDKVENRNITYTVVGLYTGDSNYTSNIFGMATLSAASIEISNYNTVIYTVNDLNACNRRLASSKYKCVETHEYAYQVAKEANATKSKLYTIFFTVLTVVSAVFIYFLMRSRMISDIYTIGVYRQLGCKRTRIVGKYLSDSVVLTTMTAIFGYLIGLFSYVYISKLVNIVFNSEMLNVNYGIYALGALGLYLVIGFFGILPIIVLLSKTPREICAKYDI